MQINPFRNPSLQYHEEIKQLCQPLTKLNISYFAHSRINDKDEFSAICNHPVFYEQYLKNQYYNADIHLADSDQLGKFVIWDNVELDSTTEKMELESIALGVKHTFTIIKEGKNESDFYHFATHRSGKSINQFYLAHLDLLETFIQHFSYHVGQSKLLSHAYSLTHSIDPEAQGYIIKSADELAIPHKLKKELLNELQLGKSRQLSKRELECLQFYIRGKSAKQIANVVGLSHRTIEHYLENIKIKMNVNNRSDLIEKSLIVFPNQILQTQAP